MARGRLQSEWLRTGSVMALLANINRDPKQRRKPFDATDFMPPDLVPDMPRRRRPKEDPSKVKILETVFPAK